MAACRTASIRKGGKRLSQLVWLANASFNFTEQPSNSSELFLDVKVRLLAIDLDGTLLTSQRAIHPDNFGAVQRARQAGIKIVLASGRVRASMMPFAKELELEGPLICANGSHVLSDGGLELAFHGVDHRVFHIVSEYVRERNIHLNIYTRSELYYLSDTRWLEVYKSRVRTLIPTPLAETELDAIDVAKLMIVDEPDANLNHMKNLAAELEGLPVHITESEPEYLEFLSPDSDKGAGLRLIAETMGIKRAEVAAIGDYLNDLGMIKYAPISAAVGNAHEQLKALAASLVRSNDKAGVAEFIDSVVLNQQE